MVNVVLIVARKKTKNLRTIGLVHIWIHGKFASVHLVNVTLRWLIAPKPWNLTHLCKEGSSSGKPTLICLVCHLNWTVIIANFLSKLYLQSQKYITFFLGYYCTLYWWLNNRNKTNWHFSDTHRPLVSVIRFTQFYLLNIYEIHTMYVTCRCTPLCVNWIRLFVFYKNIKKGLNRKPNEWENWTNVPLISIVSD